jgi:hypothetical protein
MRKVRVARMLMMVALALLVAGPVFAQDKEITVAGGYAGSWYSVSGGSTTAPVGFMVNVAGTVAPNIQVVGDLGFSHKSNIEGTGVSANFLTGTGGVRYLFSQVGDQAKPFVEGLVGLGYISAGFSGPTGRQTGVAFGVGGGVDIKAKNEVGVRLQVNYFLNRIDGMNLSEVRFGVGISFHNKM